MSDRGFDTARAVQQEAEPAAERTPIQMLAVQAEARQQQSADVVQRLGAQRGRAGGGGTDAAAVQRAAAHGIQGSGGTLPHMGAIQRSFGRHDVSGIQAHVGGKAAEASDAMGANAYATGDAVAFKRTPGLHTAAHEAAHVVQQQAGSGPADGVGRPGDPFERHADAVADAVVAGQDASQLLASPPAGSPAGVARVVQREGEGEAEDEGVLLPTTIRVSLAGRTLTAKAKDDDEKRLTAGKGAYRVYTIQDVPTWMKAERPDLQINFDKGGAGAWTGRMKFGFTKDESSWAGMKTPGEQTAKASGTLGTGALTVKPPPSLEVSINGIGKATFSDIGIDDGGLKLSGDFTPDDMGWLQKALPGVELSEGKIGLSRAAGKWKSKGKTGFGLKVGETDIFKVEMDTLDQGATLKHTVTGELRLGKDAKKKIAITGSYDAGKFDISGTTSAESLSPEAAAAASKGKKGSFNLTGEVTVKWTTADKFSAEGKIGGKYSFASGASVGLSGGVSFEKGAPAVKGEISGELPFGKDVKGLRGAGTDKRKVSGKGTFKYGLGADGKFTVEGFTVTVTITPDITGTVTASYDGALWTAGGSIKGTWSPPGFKEQKLIPEQPFNPRTPAVRIPTPVPGVFGKVQAGFTAQAKVGPPIVDFSIDAGLDLNATDDILTKLIVTGALKFGAEAEIGGGVDGSLELNAILFQLSAGLSVGIKVKGKGEVSGSVQFDLTGAEGNNAAAGVCEPGMGTTVNVVGNLNLDAKVLGLIEAFAEVDTILSKPKRFTHPLAETDIAKWGPVTAGVAVTQSAKHGLDYSFTALAGYDKFELTILDKAKAAVAALLSKTKSDGQVKKRGPWKVKKGQGGGSGQGPGWDPDEMDGAGGGNDGAGGAGAG